jgi:RHS repeat-associated protein
VESVVNSYDYTAFGEALNWSENIPQRYTYTSREWDSESSTYHYRARQYNPTSGRFTARDPIGYLAGLNLYSYVGNNPIMRTDPSGLSPNGDEHCQKDSEKCVYSWKLVKTHRVWGYAIKVTCYYEGDLTSGPSWCPKKISHLDDSQWWWCADEPQDIPTEPEPTPSTPAPQPSTPNPEETPTPDDQLPGWKRSYVPTWVKLIPPDADGSWTTRNECAYSCNPNVRNQQSQLTTACHNCCSGLLHTSRGVIYNSCIAVCNSNGSGWQDGQK